MHATRGAAFSNAELDELVASLRERGIIQPIIARPVRGAAEAYEIIAGERRWRAAQRAGLHEVPVVIIEATDAESLQIAIIENVQRADLNPLEEADGYRALMDEFGNSQDEIAKTVGKSRSHVANTLRLLKLPETVKGYIHAGKLSAGHARMLIGQPNAEELAEEIVARGLNVRQVEAMARDVAEKSAKGHANGRKITNGPRRTPICSRWKNAFPMRWAWRSASTIASAAAFSAFVTAISISSTKCCAVWKKSTERRRHLPRAMSAINIAYRGPIGPAKSRPARPAFQCAVLVALSVRHLLRRKPVGPSIMREISVDQPAANERHYAVRDADIHFARRQRAIEQHRSDERIGDDACGSRHAIRGAYAS